MPSSAHFELVDLSGRRIFVTGGTGFIGKTLLDHFAESAATQVGRFDVCVLSRDPQAFLAACPQYAGHDWLRFSTGDLLSLAPAGEHYTDMIHAAADTHGVDGATWTRQIVDGTRVALDFALSSGVQRFLLMSSGAVYGSQPAHVERLGEDFSGAPSTSSMAGVYGQAKRVAEQLCTVYHHEHGLETVVARCFAVVSEHMPFNGPYAIGNFIRDALRGKSIHISGDPRTVRSYLYGKDVAHWITTMLLKGLPGHSYNLGSDQPVTLHRLAEMTSRYLTDGKPIEVASSPDAIKPASLYVPCIDKAATLGLRVTTPLDEAIRLTAHKAAAFMAGSASLRLPGTKP